MNTSANRIYASKKAPVYTALMFALAVLLLVVSCPLKRLLQAATDTYSTSQVRINEVNSNQQSSAGYHAVSCVVIKKKVNLVSTASFQKFKVLPAFWHPAHFSEQSGFSIYYFLSGIPFKYAVVISTTLSSLPLFLQYRRLLI